MAIVTGAASGIGRATAILLAKEGARVIITDINAQGGKESVELAGHGAVFMPLDVGNEDAWKTVASGALAKFGRLDILVNNAASIGDESGAGPEDTSVEKWLEIHRVTALGPFLGCKHAIPAMRRSGGGSIVNISSAGALIPSPMETAYGMAKAGVTNLTITVAMHCATRGDNIRCNAIYPGGTRTPMLEGLFETLAKQMEIPDFSCPATMTASFQQISLIHGGTK
ncbi:MAG: SDR family NAD(P)-dependent oxidoreductase [Proteobacteria bacterium]|nr:SDR family NAD(P)-dependent oxidoreductase [Pseudomonadota bacterium]